MRGMSRSDKGCAGSGEDGKVTSGQEGLQTVAVRDDNFSGPSGGGIAPLHSQDRLVFLLHKTARTLRFPAFLVTFDTKSNAKRSVANQGIDNPSVFF